MTEETEEMEETKDKDINIDFDIDFDKRSGVEELVARFGGLRPCAARLGLAVGTVQGWKKRGSIPPAHQQKIRVLLHASPQEQKQGKGEDTSATIAQEQTTAQKGQEKKKEDEKEEEQESKKKEEPKKKEDASSFEIAAGEEVATEEGIVSAFTSGDDFAKGDEEGLDISSEVWNTRLCRAAPAGSGRS